MFDSILWAHINTGTAVCALIRVKRLRKAIFDSINTGGANLYTLPASIATNAININKNHFNHYLNQTIEINPDINLSIQLYSIFSKTAPPGSVSEKITPSNL